MEASRLGKARSRPRRGYVHAAALAGLLLAWHPVRTADPPAAETTPETKPAPAGIRGRVTGSDGQPIVGATVRILPSQLPKGAAPDADWPEPLLSTTDESGSFAATLDGEKLIVRVEAPGFAPFTSEPTPAGESVSARLDSGYSVGGSVFDRQTGKSIAAARVVGCDGGAMRFGEKACSSTMTDENGSFTLRHAPPGNLRLEALADAHARSEPKTVHLPESDAGGARRPEIRFDLGPGGRLAGRIIDRGKHGLARVRLHLQPHEGRLKELARDRNRQVIFSDPEGGFTFEGVPAGQRYTLHATRRGWPEGEAGPYAIEPGSNIRGIEVVLLEGARLALRLVDPDERPVQSKVELWLRKPSEGPRGPFAPPGEAVSEDSIKASAEGVTTVVKLKEGRYDILIDVEGWDSPARRDVRLVSGETTDLGTIVLEKGLSISGRVTDSDGRPIAGASIQATVNGELGISRRTATSDEQGRYEVAGLGDAPVPRMQAAAEKYVSAYKKDVTPGQTGVDFTLGLTGGVSGRAVLESGEAATAFTVQAHPEASGAAGFEGGSRQAPKGITDPQGAFRLDRLAPGVYTMELKAEGKAPARKQGVNVAGGETADAGVITLRDGAILRGRVLAGREGSPVAAARVEAKQAGGALFELPTASAGITAATDDQGGFALRGLGTGVHDVRAEHPDFAPVTASVEIVSGQEPDEVVLRLARGGTLAGTVRDSRGQPTADARVLLMQGMMKMGDARHTSTGPDGRYEMQRLEPGSYQVMRSPEPGGNAFNLQLKTAVIRDGETTIVDFGEAPRISVSGTVRRGGQALAEATLIFLSTDGGAMPTDFQSARSDPAGRYEVGLERAGPYRVVAQLAGRPMFGSGVQVEVVVADQPRVELDIVLPQSEVSGTVLDADGAPLAGASIGARRAGAAAGELAGQAGALTDAAGHYRLEGLADGAYEVAASAPGFRVGLQSVSITEDRRTASVDFRLERGLTLRGQLVDGQGQGIAGAMVFAAPAGGANQVLAAPTNTDVNGTFRLIAPSDGPLDVTAVASGWAPARATGVLPSDDPENPGAVLTAGPGGRLRIQVVGSDGTPRGGVRILVRARPPFLASDAGLFFSPPSATDGSGVSRVERLAPWTYEVSLPGRRDVPPVLATVNEGGETPVQLRLP